MFYGRPEILADVAGLKAWATELIRFDKGAKKWLLLQDDRGWYLRHREAPSRWSKDRTPTPHYQRLSNAFGAELSRKWPRGDNEGRKHLTPSGIVDLVSHSAGVRAEGKRLRELDAERMARQSALEHHAERHFEALEGVRELEDRGAQGHTCRQRPHWQTSDACPKCAAAGEARTRAYDRYRAWIRTPLEALGGRTPDDVAAESQDGLRAALQLLEAITAAPAASEAA